MSKISIQGSLKTEQIPGSYSDVEKKIVADLDSAQVKDGKKPFSKIADEVVIEPYRDGSYAYHAMLTEAAKMYDLSPEIQKDAQVSNE
ncbi:hypothetical protein [Lentilactobacillus kefiri]|jgi:hypothetical protein|uniref:Uncharacterized protein n=2 Tax=Lentilactobacillus kefiri TaxID=33962 RepID=A0A8E1V2H9_LENKE|nr:hypothetical protein [Lentilactobacillus kefiri]KRL71723.1 hypothetical protein FD08_GL000279 [Lentilactobacillus parakefiri DSM 10551]KRM53400.1 hypothetical protein FC95_GL000879 [Lentilactobacillus kefiri DSM 20587 = JCM 5818]MCJ2161735.1 hypothetical protein [Lentilactobacillus kefiri]MCP9369407.1 hypothetical protein [Lentilactobacillus kefiri]MDH5108443.1 hypothetical protein [Lentilactobacillus kefiri]